MTDENERKAITEAMQRLLAGKPLRSSGRLDIVTLAEEAGLKRNKLTHKHTDLKDLFNAERRARDGVGFLSGRPRTRTCGPLVGLIADPTAARLSVQGDQPLAVQPPRDAGSSRARHERECRNVTRSHDGEVPVIDRCDFGPPQALGD